jgi:hypothetical protein
LLLLLLAFFFFGCIREREREGSYQKKYRSIEGIDGWMDDSRGGRNIWRVNV